ncbi:Protein FAR1-RELATED SEQUENCE 5 [Linum perenne]
MGGKQPKAVITDGDKAMALAISKAFPNAPHRLCSWHLNKNVTQNVKNEKFQSGWEKFVDASYNEGEFTEKWDSFVEECELQSNTWVRDHLFNKRKQWAHTYLQNTFFGGMKTTSRCEGLNSILRNYVRHSCSLLEFFTSYGRWMKDLREEEIRLDYQSNHCAPELTSTTMRSVEKSASTIYTLEAFKKIKMSYRVVPVGVETA